MAVDPIRATTLELPGISHGFYTRTGGTSTGLYRGLNCGLGSDDDRETVVENRRRVAVDLGAHTLLTVHQIHSPDVVVVDAPFEGALPKADGMVTCTPGLALGALAADCAPVLFAAPDAGIVGAAHAGWRGALGGVGDAVIATMERLGADRTRIVAVVGPTISKASYEVGPEFIDTFVAADAANDAYFTPSPRDGHAMFDLPAYLGDRLRRLGLGTVQVLDACTYADETLFYSYRRSYHREEPDYGRQVSAIALTED